MDVFLDPFFVVQLRPSPSLISLAPFLDGSISSYMLGIGIRGLHPLGCCAGRCRDRDAGEDVFWRYVWELSFPVAELRGPVWTVRVDQLCPVREVAAFRRTRRWIVGGASVGGLG